MGGASELWSPEPKLTFPFLGTSPLLLLESAAIVNWVLNSLFISDEDNAG